MGNDTMTSTDITERIAVELDRLATIGETAGIHSLARELRDDRIPALREGTMTMVVLGEFNHGKSSTINALLGRPALPMGITPTTSVITHISAGTGPAKLIMEDRVETVDADKLRERIVTEPPNDLKHVEVQVDAPFLRDGLVIVDTPGVNDISQQKVEITYGYVPRSDVVVYVLDATQALKRSEISFIQDRLIRNQLDRLFFVLGKVDALAPEEVEEIVTHVRTRLADLLGEVNLYPISARTALTGRDEGFEIFRDALRGYVDTQRDAIVIESALRTGTRVASLMDQSLAIEEGAMALAAEDLSGRIASVKERLGRSRMMVSENLELIDKRCTDISASTRENVRTFAREFSAALPREVDRARTDQIKRYLPDFIHDTFKEFIEGEGLHTAMRLEQLAEEIISITNRNMREAVEDVEQELGMRARDVNLEVDTFAYDVGVFALGALGMSFMAFSNMLVGGVLFLSAPILAFALKGRVDEAIRERAREQGLAAIQNASQKVEEEFDAIIDDFRQRLKQFVEDAGDRLYRQVADALDRVLVDRREHVENTEPAIARIKHAREQLASVRKELGTIRDARAQVGQAG